MWSYLGNLNFVGGSSPEIFPMIRCTSPGMLRGPRKYNTTMSDIFIRIGLSHHRIK
nr:MAG TPA: hypothetical protein [Caudoviricetes sp.]